MKSDQPLLQIQYDPELPALLSRIKATIAITTYQAGKLVFISAKDESSLLQTPVSFRKPMGVALLEDKMAVATLDEVHVFSNSPALARDFPYSQETFDALYLPRAVYFSGETDLHDIHFARGGLWAANTLFSCISSYDINHSFNPRWKPDFISELVPEDRCHLNGMATIDFTPAYVTALGQTNHRQGWRENIISGGVLMKVPSGEVLLDKLPMPHSPRVIDGELYLLLSATGEVIKYNPARNSYEVIYTVPGFIRGMAYHEGYLFIGASKARESSKTFSKLPVASLANWAGLIVIDLASGTKIAELRYQTTVEEIFDVQILPGIQKPGLIPIDDKRHKLAVSFSHGAFWKNQD
jgi:uncharacterized protein (TIGR03032 family)